MIRKKSIWLFFGLILFKLLTDFTYREIISVLFGYQNFNLSPSTEYQILSWIVLLLFSPLIINIISKKGLSNSILTVLICVSFIPTLTMIGYNSSYPLTYILQILTYWIILLIATVALPPIRFKIHPLFQKFKIADIIILILCLNVFYLSWRYTGFRFHFGLMNVYEIRTEARSYQFPKIFGYLLTFADNILPIGLVYYMNKKKWLIAVVLIVMIYLNFSITATKQIFFLLLLAIIGYFFIRELKISKHILLGFLLLMSAGALEYFFFSTYLISTLSTYRVFFIPAKLHYVYYNYFSVNELDYFRQSFLKGFLDSPYKENIGFLMGYVDIGDFTARANNGLFSDAYFNLGTLGIIIFPFVITIILKLLDGAIHGLMSNMFFIIIVSYSFVLLGLPFSTILLSGGFIPLIIYLYSIPRKNIPDNV